MKQEIKDRIFAAADRLLAMSETGDIPTVEQVRKEAQASMNNVVEALKEWRQKQRSVVKDVVEPLPEVLQGVILEMGQLVWKTAREKANEALESARASFEAEKNDLVRLSQEQSQAYDLLAQEADDCRAELLQATQEVETKSQTIDDQQRQLAKLQERLALAEARTSEIEKRANGLESELERVHAESKVELERVHAESKVEQLKTGGEIQRLNALLAQAGKEKAEVESALHQSRQEEAVQRAEKASYVQLVEAERAREREAGKVVEDRLRAQLEKAVSDGAESARAAAQYLGELGAMKNQVQELSGLLKSFAGQDKL